MKEGNHLRDAGVDGGITLKLMLNKLKDGGTWSDSSCSGQEQVFAVVQTAMKLPVPYLLTGCGAVGFSICTVLHAVCCLLFVLVRRTACCLCVVLCTGLC